LRKILLTDDDQNVRRMLTRVLSTEGYFIKEATDGLDAIKKLEKENYSLILLDLKMPGLNGLETLKKIRESDYNLPVIMMSAYGTVTEAVEAMKLGALDYLVKPFDIEELKNFKGTLIGTAKVVAYAITIAVASGGVFIIAKVLSYI